MYYNSFNSYLKKRFGQKVRKIGLNAHFTCPHTEEGPCVFCNELGFSEFAGTSLSVEDQIEEVIESGRADKYIAYFQNATGTNAPCEKLKAVYDTVREYPEIVGISISTRPDSIDEEKLNLIAGYTDDYDVWVEYGMQTMHEGTLQGLKRGHTHQDTVKAVKSTSKKGIKTGVHIILGLPGESHEDMMTTAVEVSHLPISGVKLHMLHVLKNTALERMYKEGKVPILSRSEYVSLACDFMERLDKKQIILRAVSDAKKEYLIAPTWMEDKLGTLEMINAEFKRRGSYQGSFNDKRVS